MSGTLLNSSSLILCLSLAVGAAATLGAGCSSSDATDAAAGQSSGGKTGKAGAHSTAEAGDGAVEQAGAPGEGGAIDMESGGTSAAGTTAAGAGRSAGGSSSGGTHAGGSGGKAGSVSAEAGAPESEAGAAGASEPMPDPNAAAKARALELINGLEPVRRCTTCHQSDYAGLGFYPNLTPDETNGIGGWSDAQIKAAIHDGKRNDGTTLCLAMERYPFSATQLDDLVIYLRSIPANAKKNSAVCPH